MTKIFKKGLFLGALFFWGITIEALALAEGVKVGLLLPLTGKLARFGEMERRSFLMAAEKTNEAGGINGKELHLIFEDTAGKPHQGRAAIKNLILEDNVSLIGGGFSSTVTWETAKIAQENKVPFLVTTASADKITEKGGDYIFRITPPAGEYPAAMNSFFTDVAKVKTVAVLYENAYFSQSRLKECAKWFKKLGLKVVSKWSYELQRLDFEPLLSRITATKPDLFYMICSTRGPQASLIVRQARELNLNTRLYVGDGAIFTQSQFQEQAGIASEYVFAVTPWTSSVKYDGAGKYSREFVLKYLEPADYHGAQAYAAMQVMADALKRASTFDPADVRDALAETDMSTIFGPVKFISYGKKKLQNKIPVFLGQWIKGNFEAVWPEELTDVDYVYPLPVWNDQNNDLGPAGAEGHSFQ